MILEISNDNKFLVLTKCTEIELDQLKLSLTKKIKSWRFHPLVKKGIWDGKISYIYRNKYIPIGLWREVLEIAKQYDFPIQFNGLTEIFDQTLKQDDFNKWALNFMKGSELKPRDYQLETAYRILKFKRCSAELSTASGKTLIAFLVLAYILNNKLSDKILMIVPNVSLVLQAAEDFQDYDHENKLKLKIQQVYSGQKIKKNSNIVIGTYQSLVKKKKDYFEQFDTVIIDETHRSKSHSIKTILEKCNNTNYRFGLTGTFPGKNTLERLTLMAATGPLITEISANFLQQRGFITKCKVHIIEMNYAPETTRTAFSELGNNKYDKKDVFSLEQNYIINSQDRLNFITGVISKVTKNSLVLFYRREHGQNIYKKLKKICKNKSIYYVDGKIDKDIREMYKKKMERNNNVILVASFGTFSTGINIKNIHNIFFTESFKSEVIIRQSIGRGLRLHSSKDIVTIIDFVDNFCHDDWQNYLYKHALERRKIYTEQKFPYKINQVNF